MLKIIIKKKIKKNFPNIFEILKIFWTNILKKKNSNIKFSGWGLSTTISTPWSGHTKNKTFVEFDNAKNNLEKKIKNKEFFLSMLENTKENTSFEDVFNHYKELDYRHYVVYFSALYAFENCKNRNIVECGTADGLAIFFAISKFKQDKNYKAYLYDAWEGMREKELATEQDRRREGNYSYLDIETTKKNLKDFSNNIFYNKGFIPDSFKNSINPEKISWLSIDLNSSLPTFEALSFFFPRLEAKGVILLDDYGHETYEDTRLVVEKFFENKDVLFLQLMTGQAIIIKN